MDTDQILLTQIKGLIFDMQHEDKAQVQAAVEELRLIRKKYPEQHAFIAFTFVCAEMGCEK